MAAPQNIVAVIFDFDDTLTDDSTTKLLQTRGIDPDDFWKGKMKRMLDEGWDPPLGYLKLILDNVGENKALGKLTNAELNGFGRTLNFYPGLPDLFNDLHEVVKKHRLSSPAVEFYIISGGLEEIIKGSSIAPHFTGIWGCRFAEEDGVVRHVRNAISFTEKTKYIFAINKGLDPEFRTDPYRVNSYVSDADRRIPLKQMIYVGDGLTDVPCFSLIQRAGGKAFGVFDPAREGSPRKAWEQLVAPKRVDTMNSPRYGEKDDLGALLRAAVTEICIGLDVRLKSARLG